MSHVIAIAGGSGGLGRTLVDAFKNSPYKTFVLARQTNPALEAELGVPVLQADYSNQDSLVQLLESHNIDTVISTISKYGDANPHEINLIKAADQASVTHRFIPSVWGGFDYKEEQGQGDPFAEPRLSLVRALRETNLEWTAVFVGMFLDYYTLTVPSYVKRTALAIDIDANAAGIPGDGNYPIYFTHTTDIAKYTVALLGLDRWEKKTFLYADETTWNEVIAIAEAAKGVKFDVAYDSIAKLKGGEMTELPGHKTAYGMVGGENAKAVFQKLFAGAAVYMAEGNMVYEGPLLNLRFPDIRPLTVREALLKSGVA